MLFKSWKTLAIVSGIIVLLGLTIGLISWAALSKKRSQRKHSDNWWEQTVIYQIYPRSFKDSDGDGIGDIQGIIMELDHFVDAGVDVILLCPILRTPAFDFGYDAVDFYDVHEEYGTVDDFDKLVKKAHNLGIKVYIDFVPNHSSIFSDFFQRSEVRDPAYENWFIWADPKPDPNNASNLLLPSNWISQFGGSVWAWSDIRQQYYLHQFGVEQPDFNFREPAVRQEMINILCFWFNKGVDGFVLTAMNYLFEANPEEHGGEFPDEPLSGDMFLTPDEPGYTTEIYVRGSTEVFDVVYEWRKIAELHTKHFGGSTKVMLSGSYEYNITMTMLYYGDERGKLGAHFPFNFDFITDLSSKSNARDFAYIILRWMTYMPKGHVPNWVFGSQDQSRMASRFRNSMVDGLNAVKLMLPGVAITYQGEEIGMRNGIFQNTGDNVIRRLRHRRTDNETNMEYGYSDPSKTPYQWNSDVSAGFSTNNKTWLPIAQDYKEINLELQKKSERSHYKVFQALTKLRKKPALSRGHYHVEALSKNTLLLVRYLAVMDTYALVFNVGSEEDTVDLSQVGYLAEPLRIYTSSVQSHRTVGDVVPFGPITLQDGEAIVIQAPPTIFIP